MRVKIDAIPYVFCVMSSAVEIGGKMKKILIIIFMLLLLVTLNHAGSYTVKKQEDIQKTLKFTGTAKQKALKIDNIFGSIDLVGYSGKEVTMRAKKTIKAKSEEKAREAQADVKLDISLEGDNIEIIVDGPFRDEEGKVNWDCKLGYTVQYDFEIKLPRHTNLYLKTINEGFVKVKDVKGNINLRNVNGIITAENIEGDFKVKTVNGKVVVSGISGSGTAHTVNGKVKVDFDRNPRADCSFKTINGKLEVSFQKNLSADFRLKTFHGEIYTDFPATYLPSPPAKGERKKGKFIYKANRFQGIRIGSGGPEIKMDTLNGNIYISEAK